MTAEAGHRHGNLARRTRQGLQLHDVLPRFFPGPDRLRLHSVRANLHPDLRVAGGRARVAASLVRQRADLFTRRTRALMTLVRLPLAVVADRWDLARLVARRWPDSLPGAARHRDPAAAASALYNVRSGARIAGTAVARRGAFVLAAVERVLARFLTGIGRVPRYAIAALPVAQMSTAQAHLHAFLVAVELLRAGDLLRVTAASARLRYDL